MPPYVTKMDDAGSLRVVSKYYKYVKDDILSTLKLSIRETLDNGLYYEVYRAKHKTRPRTDISIKVYPFKNISHRRRCKRIRTFTQESAIRKELDHENISLYIKSFLCPTYAAVLTEYCPEGCLYDCFKTLSDAQIRRYFVQVSSALMYMHGKRIVHRDVKHLSVVLRGKDACLTDFGFAEILPAGNDMLASFAGAPEFMAPEEYANYGKAKEFDAFKADAFSMGVLLWVMIMKEDKEEGDETMCVRIEAKREQYPVLADCAIELMQWDPSERKTVSQVMTDLETKGYDFLKYPLPYCQYAVHMED